MENRMYALMGETDDVYQDKIGEPFKTVTSPPEIVAFFDEKKDAERYIKQSRLKNPPNEGFIGERPFRKSSLLCYYSRAWVTEHTEETYPYNPTLRN